VLTLPDGNAVFSDERDLHRRHVLAFPNDAALSHGGSSGAGSLEQYSATADQLCAAPTDLKRLGAGGRGRLFAAIKSPEQGIGRPSR